MFSVIGESDEPLIRRLVRHFSEDVMGRPAEVVGRISVRHFSEDVMGRPAEVVGSISEPLIRRLEPLIRQLADSFLEEVRRRPAEVVDSISADSLLEVVGSISVALLLEPLIRRLEPLIRQLADSLLEEVRRRPGVVGSIAVALLLEPLIRRLVRHFLVTPWKITEQLEEELQEQRIIQAHTPGLPCYKMNSRPRGLCVLINNLNFQNNIGNRNGSQFDERKLEDLFRELSFTVSVLKDLSHDKMRNAALDFASKDHSQFDAFVFVVMSHGGERDVIYGVDGRTTRVEDLMSEFKAPNCPTLRNKPKLFFIQTCRGSTQDEAFSATTGDFYSCMDTFSPDSTLPRSVCPQEADFLLAFATAPGYVAWRNQQSGSFFVQTLVKVIRKRHFHDHLLDMLTEVNRLVVEIGQTANGGPGRIQVPAPIHTLRAKLYL